MIPLERPAPRPTIRRRIGALAEGTIRVQIAKGKLRARKVGRDWQLTPGEIERYRRENRGQATGGRKAKR